MKSRVWTGIRLAPNLKFELESIAEEREISLNALFCQILKEYVNKEKTANDRINDTSFNDKNLNNIR